MWLYLLIFFIPVFVYYQSARFGFGKNTRLLAIYTAILALFVGFSDMLGGYDRYIYGEVFDTIADVTNLHGSYISNECFDYFPREYGYTILNIIISYFSSNRYIFILIITLIIYTCLFISIRRYATNYPLAIIIFLGLWFYFSFTYLRQVLGATIVWLSIPYIRKRKFLRFLILNIIAISIHKSAIIFFPVYFIANRRFSRSFIIKALVIIAIFGLSPFPNALFNAYGDMSQVEMQSDYNASGGFRIAYFLEAIFFLWIILRKYNIKNYSPIQVVMLNIALLFCATLLFFIRSENGGRLSWYYMIGIISTLTTIATKRQDKKYTSSLLIIVCLILFVRIYKSWQDPKMVGLYPYKTFLTNGHRQNDPIEDRFEYDEMYNVNKMYRKPFQLDVNLGSNN